MFALASALPLLQSALSVIGSFTGGAAAAKTAAHVQEAVSVVSSLTPLFQQFGQGVEVTDDDVRKALANKDSALAALDAEIAKRS